MLPCLRAVVLGCSVLLAPPASAQTAISYQGRLKLGDVPVNGSYDFRVSLWDAATGGTKLVGPLEYLSVATEKGLFSLAPDFGADAWDGSPRYLEIAVRQSGQPTFTTLTPRQPIAPVPYAIHAKQGEDWGFDSSGVLEYATKNPQGPEWLLHVDDLHSPSGGQVFYLGGDQSGFILHSMWNNLSLSAANSPNWPARNLTIAANTGWVGIGTDTPTHQLDVSASTSELRIGLSNTNPDGGRHYSLVSSATGSGIAPGHFAIYDGSPGGGTRLEIDADGRTGIAALPTSSAALHLGAGASSSLLVESGINGSGDLFLTAGTGHAMRLNASGDWVVVGNTGGGGGRLGVGRLPSTQTLEIEGNGFATGQWLRTSDARAKENVRSISDAIETLRQVRPVLFEFREWYLAQHPAVERATQAGVIAQEFRGVFPGAVKPIGVTAPDGSPLLGVDTSQLIPYSVSAILELDQRNADLDAKNAALESTVRSQASEIAELRERLARLERLIAGSAPRH